MLQREKLGWKDKGPAIAHLNDLEFRWFSQLTQRCNLESSWPVKESSLKVDRLSIAFLGVSNGDAPRSDGADQLEAFCHSKWKKKPLVTTKVSWTLEWFAKFQIFRGIIFTILLGPGTTKALALNLGSNYSKSQDTLYIAELTGRLNECNVRPKQWTGREAGGRRQEGAKKSQREFKMDGKQSLLDLSREHRGTVGEAS